MHTRSAHVLIANIVYPKMFAVYDFVTYAICCVVLIAVSKSQCSIEMRLYTVCMYFTLMGCDAVIVVKLFGRCHLL